MDIFDTIFMNRKKGFWHDNGFSRDQRNIFHLRKVCPGIRADNIRVMLYRDCDIRGRKLLFDSSSVSRTNLNQCPPSTIKSKLPFIPALKGGGVTPPQQSTTAKNEHFVEITQGFGYQYLKPQSDSRLLSEMVFGAAPMSFRGTTVKVHHIQSPPRLVLSKVFSAPYPRSGNQSSDKSLNGSCSSSGSVPEDLLSRNSSLDNVGRTSSVEVPGFESLQKHCGEGDSGISGGTSYQSSGSLSVNSSLLSIPQYGSPLGTPSSNMGSSSSLRMSGSLTGLQRRWYRARSTSMERTRSPHMDSFSSDTNSQCATANMKTKLGLVLMIMLDDLDTELVSPFMDFYFLHLPMLEGMVSRLQTTTEQAYFNKKEFVHLVMEGTRDIQQSVLDLTSAARISNPTWLSCLTSDQSKTASKFMQEFVQLSRTLDTKENNFFLSTLLTGVLTHHLSWVPTVIPKKGESRENFNQSKSSPSDSGSCNPLWIQLGDLYGSIGHPRRLAKTVLSGTHVRLLQRLLFVLTYFIRCCTIRERCPERKEFISVPKKKMAASSDQAPAINMESKSLWPSLLDVDEANILPHLSEADKGDLKSSSDTRRDRTPLYPSLDDTSCDSGYLSSEMTLCQDSKVSRLIRIPKQSQQQQLSSLDCPARFKINDAPVITNEPSNKTFCGASSRKVCFVVGDEVLPEGIDSISTVDSSLRDTRVETTTLVGRSRDILTSDDSILKQHSWDPSCKSSLYPQLSDEKQSEKTYEDQKFLQSCSLSDTVFDDSGTFESFPSLHSLGDSLQNDKSNVLNFSAAQQEDLKLAEVSLPLSVIPPSSTFNICFGTSLLGSVSDHYMPDFVLHATTDRSSLEPRLRSDLYTASQNSVLGEEMCEAVCVIGDVDNLTVELVSSHSYATERTEGVGIRFGMSQLVANLVEKLVSMYHLKMSAEFCQLQLEDSLQEIFFRSCTLTQFLLADKFCDMDRLTQALGVEMNDVPLLLAVASTHTPQVTSMCGISFC